MEFIRYNSYIIFSLANKDHENLTPRQASSIRYSPSKWIIPIGQAQIYFPSAKEGIASHDL